MIELRSGGPLYVTHGSDGKVIASFQMGRVSKISQEVAEQAVRSSPGFALVQEGGTIKILERNVNTAQCSVHISAPAGSRLDLRAAAGDICVGCPQAVSVTSLKARQESVGVLTVNLLARPREASRLDLEGDNLKLTLDGLRVDVGPPSKYDRPGGPGRWHYHSE